jgi:hypothetical protein
MWVFVAAALLAAVLANTRAAALAHHLAHIEDDLGEVRNLAGLPRVGSRCDLPPTDDPGRDR